MGGGERGKGGSTPPRRPQTHQPVGEEGKAGARMRKKAGRGRQRKAGKRPKTRQHIRKRKGKRGGRGKEEGSRETKRGTTLRRQGGRHMEGMGPDPGHGGKGAAPRWGALKGQPPWWGALSSRPHLGSFRDAVATAGPGPGTHTGLAKTRHGTQPRGQAAPPAPTSVPSLGHQRLPCPEEPQNKQPK